MLLHQIQWLEVEVEMLRKELDQMVRLHIHEIQGQQLPKTMEEESVAVLTSQYLITTIDR